MYLLCVVHPSFEVKQLSSLLTGFSINLKLEIGLSMANINNLKFFDRLLYGLTFFNTNHSSNFIFGITYN